MTKEKFRVGQVVEVKDTISEYEGVKGEIIEIDWDNHRKPILSQSGVYPYRVKFENDDGTVEKRWALENQIKPSIPICNECNSQKVHSDENNEWYCPFCDE